MVKLVNLSALENNNLVLTQKCWKMIMTILLIVVIEQETETRPTKRIFLTNEITWDKLEPVLSEIKFLHIHLDVLRARLYKLYDFDPKDNELYQYCPITRKLVTILQKLNTPKSSTKIFQKVQLFINKYLFSLDQMREYHLRPSRMEIIEKRMDIFSHFHDTLNLFAVELEFFMATGQKLNKNAKLVYKVQKEGDLSTMKTMDLCFVAEFSIFLDSVIELMDRRSDLV